jgi:hypothetical protein
MTTDLRLYLIGGVSNCWNQNLTVLLLAFSHEADPTPWNYPSAGTRTWAGLWVLYILTQVPVIWSRQCCILLVGHFKGWLSSAYLLPIIDFLKCPIGYIWVDWLLNHRLFKTLFKCRDLNNWWFKGHFYEHFLTHVEVMAIHGCYDWYGQQLSLAMPCLYITYGHNNGQINHEIGKQQNQFGCVCTKLLPHDNIWSSLTSRPYLN